MSGTAKRRWFQFRLRTLLVSVVLLAIPCAYVAYEARIVADRKHWLADRREHVVVFAYPGDPIHKKTPWLRSLFGDDGIDELVVGPKDEQAAKRLFPETVILVGTGQWPYNVQMREEQRSGIPPEHPDIPPPNAGD